MTAIDGKGTTALKREPWRETGFGTKRGNRKKKHSCWRADSRGVQVTGTGKFSTCYLPASPPPPTNKVNRTISLRSCTLINLCASLKLGLQLNVMLSTIAFLPLKDGTKTPVTSFYGRSLLLDSTQRTYRHVHAPQMKLRILIIARSIKMKNHVFEGVVLDVSLDLKVGVRVGDWVRVQLFKSC